MKKTFKSKFLEFSIEQDYSYGGILLPVENEPSADSGPSFDAATYKGIGLSKSLGLPDHVETGPPAHANGFASGLGNGNGLGLGNQQQSSGIFVDPGMSAQDLNTLIANADPGATITLNAGVHQFTSSIVIDRDDITLKGVDEATTIIEFSFADGDETHGLQVLGGWKSFITTTAASALAGDTQLQLNAASGVSVGDTLYIQQPNTEAYLLQNGWDNVSFDDADERPFRGFIVEVIAVDGDAVTLNSPLPYEFEASETKVFSIDLLQDVSLSDFTITHDIDREVTPNDFINPLAAYENTASLYMRSTQETSLENISVIDAPSNAIDIRSSLSVTGDDIYIDGSHNIGGGGNGYGIQLYETFDSSLTDLEIFNVRHAVLFSSWHAESGNLVEVSKTNRDINFHGSPDMNNTVIVEESILEYNPDENNGTTRGYWAIVSEGGSSHAQTDFDVNNTVQFAYAEGYDAADTIYGWDFGAYLDGNAGQDNLFGGAGDDILIGGTKKDKLTGGDGADTFVFELGDAYDRISDFDGAGEGDLIAFSNAPAIAEFDDLQIWQSDNDAYVRYGSNSTIILEQYDATSLDAGYFVFNWGGDDGVTV